MTAPFYDLKPPALEVFSHSGNFSASYLKSEKSSQLSEADSSWLFMNSTHAALWIFAGVGEEASIPGLVTHFSKTLAQFLFFFMIVYALFCVFRSE